MKKSVLAKNKHILAMVNITETSKFANYGAPVCTDYLIMYVTVARHI